MKTLSLITAILVLVGCTFAAKLPAKTYSVGQEPQVVVAADFNNDGNLDLATADYTSSDVSILLGNGDGRFQPSRRFSTTYSPSALAVGHFSHSGNLDLAVTEYGFGTAGVLAIFLGQGNGSFQPGVVYDVGSLPYDVTAADFNGDGILEQRR
jgi:hypothetical protein